MTQEFDARGRAILGLRDVARSLWKSKLGKERPAEFYDRRFARRSRWREHYTQSRYYPIWTVVVDRLKRAGVNSVVDIGCGPGQFASLLRDQGIRAYVGLDFSSLRLEHARKICPEYRFVLADIFRSSILTDQHYDAVVMLEFLEHVERDLEALAMIRSGSRVIATVPNFGGEGHVRHFATAEDVRKRYQAVLPDLSVDMVLGDAKGRTFYLIEGRR